MRKYTWIELPTWVFTSHKNSIDGLKTVGVSEPNILTRDDITLIAHICSKIDDKGFISSEDHARVIHDLGYPQEDLNHILSKFIKTFYMFLGPNPDGQYVNFFDSKQSNALFGSEGGEFDDSLRRIPFPLEISLDERLSKEDLEFLSMCFTYSNEGEKSFIDSQRVLALADVFDKRIKEVRSIMNKLQSLNYLKISHNPPGLFLLPNKHNIFISYSHKDKNILNELNRHFQSIPDTNIDVWDDNFISPGDKWKESIDLAMERADVAILLVSPDFLSSDFIRNHELPKLLEKVNYGLKLIGIYLSPCLIEFYPELSQFQFINSFDNPVRGMNRNQREEVWVKTVNSCI